MDEENFIEDKISKHMEEVIREVMIGELHPKMMVMSSSKSIFYIHEPNVFLEEDSFFEYNSHGLGMYDSDKVHSKPMSFSLDTFSFQFNY